ncbi:MAG: hypothetical protein AAGK97_11665, partial [Bacteroidota bacterium]
TYFKKFEENNFQKLKKHDELSIYEKVGKSIKLYYSESDINVIKEIRFINDYTIEYDDRQFYQENKPLINA